MASRQLITITIFGILIFVSSAAFWANVPDFFLNPLDIKQLIITLSILTVLLSFITAFSILISKLNLALVVLCLSTAPALISSNLLALPLPAGLTIYLGLFIGEVIFFYRMNADKKIYTRPEVSHLAGDNFGLLFLLFSFFLSSGYYIYANNNLSLQPVKIPEQIIDWSAKTALNFINTSQPETANLPQAAVNELILNPLKSTLRSQLQGLLDRYRSYLAPILATSFFLTLTALTSVIRIITILLSSLMLLILRSLNLVSLKKETREVEIYQII